MSYLDKPVGPRTLPVINTVLPGITYMGDYAVVFGNDVTARDKPDTAESRAAVSVLNDIAKLYEGMSIPVRLKTLAAQILEPCLVEEVQRIVIGITLLVDKFE